MRSKSLRVGSRVQTFSGQDLRRLPQRRQLRAASRPNNSHADADAAIHAPHEGNAEQHGLLHSTTTPRHHLASKSLSHQEKTTLPSQTPLRQRNDRHTKTGLRVGRQAMFPATCSTCIVQRWRVVGWRCHSQNHKESTSATVIAICGQQMIKKSP